MKKLISICVNLFLIPTFSDAVKNSGLNFIKRAHLFFKRRCFDVKIHEYIFDYCKEHSDTILGSKKFADFLKYQKPLMSICDYASGESEKSVPSDVFVNSLVTCCQDSVGTLAVDDVAVAKDLFSHLIGKYQFYFEKNVPPELKVVQSGIMRGETATIQAAIDQLPAEIKKIIESILDKQKIDADTIEHTYFLLSNQLFSGNVEVVGMVLTLLTSKCSDLEYAIQILLGLISDEIVHPEKANSNLSKISNHVIQEDLARKIILFNMNQHSALNAVMSVPSLPRELICIATDLASNNFTNIISVTEILKDGFPTLQFSVNLKYASEKELLNQILFMYVATLSHSGKYQALKDILSEASNSNIIIRLVLWTALIDEIDLDHSSEAKIATAKQYFSDMQKEQPIFDHLNKHYSKIYWRTLLNYALLFGEDKLPGIYHKTPHDIQKFPDIKKFYIYFLISKRSISSEEVIDFCNESHSYVALIEYLKQWDSEPKRIIDFLEDYKYLLSKDCLICCIYVTAIKKAKGREIALDLLNQYKKCYVKNLTYLLCVYRTTPSLENAQNMLSLYKSNEFDPCFCTVIDELIGILVFNQLYDDALQIILTNEKNGYSSFQNQQIKAQILLHQGKYLESLNIYCHLFDSGARNTEILYPILQISLEYKRPIEQSVLDFAAATQEPHLLVTVSEIYRQRDDFERSIKFATQALLIESSPTTAAQYWRSLQYSQSHYDSPNSVNENTAVVLTDDKATSVTYCIHKNGVSDNFPIIRDEIIHVDFEYAVNHNLLFKERNSLILLNDTQYMVTDILSLECFLAQYAMKILIENNMVQQFCLPEETSPQEYVDALKKWIEPHLDENGTSELLTDYQNFEQVPLPLFAIANSTRYSYEEFIEAVFNDKNFVIRNLISTHSSPNNCTGYILSFSAMLTLIKLGIPSEVLKKANVSIPESSLELTRTEYIRTSQDKNKDHVATISKFNGEVYFQEETAAEKSTWIQLALKIKTYAEQLPVQQNIHDIETAEITGENFAQILGPVDYDALSVAKHEKKCIISDEPVVVSICQFDQFQIESVSVLDFLVALQIKPDNLLDAMKQLIGMRFLIPITITAVDYLMDAYSNMSLEDKKSFMKCWSEYWRCFQEVDSSYKSRLIPTLKELISQHGVADKEQSLAEMDIWEKILQCYMNLIDAHIQISEDENGDVQVEIVSNKHNDVPS